MTTVSAAGPATVTPPTGRRARVAGLAAGLALVGAGLVSTGWPQITGRLYQRSQAQLRSKLPSVADRPVGQGDGWARLRIPAIGLDAVVIEGVSDGDLRRGPGHYASTAVPGGGLVGIAGHRTTWGAPFRSLDRLRPGDAIELVAAGSVYRYQVSTPPLDVAPSESSVLYGQGQGLVLTTCHPPGSAARRLIVRSDLVEVGP